jgi:hypothetical protein
MAGSAALAMVASARTPQTRVNAALAAMLVRLALPFAAIVYFTRSPEQSLTSHGVVGLVLVHYLAGLALETWMSVRLAASPLNAGSAGAQNQLTAH